ncbi:MAG: 3-dehydroquinate synthase [Flavobacteriia bacterium]|nr:3-dehydroquinate synthase [Flavobacteriia bacterium]
MKHLEIGTCKIEIGSIESSSFEQLLTEKYAHARKIILVDENTHDSCLEYMITTFPVLEEAEVMLLPVGEENKVMEVCFQVWEALSEYGIVRSDVIINLGGGVVTDMGGFIASVFKRGLDFINVPTSLLGMVDAAIGGKNGIDLGSYKNQLGVFQHPVAIYVDPIFLQTLPEEELVSGYAEMIKHTLIADKDQWKLLHQLDPIKLLNTKHYETLIVRSIEIKTTVVNSDPREAGMRKVLNFGHTIGHAIEGFCLPIEPIAHGHAVALGMIAESYISFKREGISQRELLEITNYLTQIYPHVPLDESDKNEVLELLKHDKKNEHDQVMCVLLNGIGNCIYNQPISEKEAYEALLYVDSVYTFN